MRPYLSIDELAAVTPWTADAIQKMLKRGVLKRGIHYFQPFGRRTQLIFKWSAIVMLIEGSVTPSKVRENARLQTAITRRMIDVEKAETGVQRLLS